MKTYLSSLSFFMFFSLLIIPLSGQSFLDSLQASFEFNRGALADESPRSVDAIGFDITSDVGLEGSINGAYKFNGFSSYMSAGTDNRNITDQLTISAWFKTTSIDRQIIVAKYNVNNDRGYALGLFNGEATLEGRDGSNLFYRLSSGNINVTDGQWHLLVGIINQNQWSLYLDCQLVDELTTSTVFPQFATPESLTIGRLSSMNNNGEFRFFDGTIDDVQLFNIALAPNQVKEISEIKCNECEDDVESGLIAYYPLNGNGLDHSGSELHGTVGGATPTPNQSGQNNAAMHFDGVDDYILVANAEALNFGTGPFAISFWAKAEDPYGSLQTLVNKGVSGEFLGPNPSYWVRLRDFNSQNQIEATLTDGHPPATDLGSTEAFFADLDWHHVVFQRTGDGLELWVDNELVASLPDTQFRNVSGNGNLILGAQNPWKVGGNIPYIHNFFKGSLDEIRLYNKALCDDEIEELSSLINGINEIPEEVGKVSIYPNPTSNILSVHLTFSKLRKVQFQLFDLNGRKYWQEDWYGQSEIWKKELKPLSSGAYILRLFFPDLNIYKSFRVIKD